MTDFTDTELPLDNTTDTTVEQYDPAHDYHALNAMLNLYDADGRIQFGKDKAAEREYVTGHVATNTKRFESTGERLRYLIDQPVLRPGGVRTLLPRVPGRLLRARRILRIRVRHVPGRVQVLHVIRAEDVRRQTVSGGLPAALRGGRARIGGRQRAAGRRIPRQDALRRVPAGHADVPEPRQGAARRGGQLLPRAHRRRRSRSISRGINAALQLSKRGGGVALLLSNLRRARRPDQAHREPVERRDSGHEAAGGLVLVREPAWREAGCRRGVPQCASSGHPALPRHEARERRREDSHQITGVGRRNPGRHVRAGQEEGQDGAVQPV